MLLITKKIIFLLVGILSIAFSVTFLPAVCAEVHLQPSYILTATFGQKSLTMKINISKQENNYGAFNYNLSDSNDARIVNGVGFLAYDVLNFNIPLIIENKLLPYNCIEKVEDNKITGACSTISSDTSGNLISQGISLTGVSN